MEEAGSYAPFWIEELAETGPSPVKIMDICQVHKETDNISV